MSSSSDLDLARRFAHAIAERILENGDREELTLALARRSRSLSHPEQRLFADVLDAVAELVDGADRRGLVRH